MKENSNENNKDLEKIVSTYNNTSNKVINFALNTLDKINIKDNDEYSNTIDKHHNMRLETLVENEPISIIKTSEEKINGVQTAINSENKQLDLNTKMLTNSEEEFQHSKKQDGILKRNIKTLKVSEDITPNTHVLSIKEKVSKAKSFALKEAKSINNLLNKTILTGKRLNTAISNKEDIYKGFETTANYWSRKPIKKAVSKAIKPIHKKVTKLTNNLLMKLVKLLINLLLKMMKIIISLLPQIVPVIIIIIVVICLISYFGITMNNETKEKYEEYMISTQEEYDRNTTDFYNQGNIVEGGIQGKGMINWKAAMSILQALGAELIYDDTEIMLLNKFKMANLYQSIQDVTYSYTQEVEETNENGENQIKVVTVNDIKKVITNPGLPEYITWCNNNFSIINEFKKKKGIAYDNTQDSFSQNEIEQIQILYNSNSFFELFSEDFKNTYAFSNVVIEDEQVNMLYQEFLKNKGKRYLMDHSNLTYNDCMEYYDCSSLVLHFFGHTNIKVIQGNTGATGIYVNHCVPINENERKAGDLIFLKDTYDTGNPGGISHVGIYMGNITLNNETCEWIIDTGGNPDGVKISKYLNGWWNGPNFYGFARLKK